MYAVLDLQTTGTKTSWHDRIVEIAIVRLDETGKVLDEWCTLVNPDRDLGPQELHGITGAEARRAPVFAALAGAIADRLAGQLVVAHSLLFDAGFLTAEFAKLGVTVPVDDDRGLCTMRLAGHFLPNASRSLKACRAAAGLGPHREYSALHGARAAGELLAYYLERAGDPPPWAELIDAAREAEWPVLPVTDTAPVSRRRPEEREPHFLTRLVERLPRQLNPKADAYLALLDGVLLDRHISASEADQLVGAAQKIGLSRADAEFLHHRYLSGLAAVALADQILTPAERLDLDGVAELLGLTPADVDRALADAAAKPAAQPAQWQLSSGDQIVFTGTLRPPREHLEVDALTHGLRTARKVTKQTRLLVAADPDSLSGVAKLARQYGIPIVSTTAYKAMLEALLTAAR